MTARAALRPASAAGLVAGAIVAGALAAGAEATPGGAPERAAPRKAVAPARAATVQLRHVAAIGVPGGGAIHRFAQRVGGLPVLGGEAVVAHPPAGSPTLVADHTVPGLRPPARPLEVGRAAAIARARAAAGVRRLRARARARPGIDPRSGRLAWEVRLPAARPLADLLVVVDARRGRMLRSHDLLRSESAAAAVFDPNPVVTQTTYTGLRDAKDRDSPQLDALRRAVTLDRLESARGCLVGRFVDARVGPRAKRVCRRSFDFTRVRRRGNGFEAVMAYFHVDRARAYIESLELSRGLRAKPQRVRANGIPDDNSYFSPFQRSITLGSGGVDDGEDADVIVHEYGHSVQDQSRRFFGETLEGAAIGEGFGDYLAAAMSSLVTGGDPRFDPCMFEWDAVSYTNNRCARRTDRPLTKSAANRRCQREPHCVGEAWSSSLWELRGVLGSDESGRSVMDRVTLESNFMLTRRSGFRDAARALVAADGLLYGGAHAAAIEAEMVERGFCRPSGC